MPDNKTWLLPDGVFDYLPEQAQKLEALRRTLLDALVASGYQLVFTPLIEFVESLLTRHNPDLDLVTFKMIDQLTGRLLGLRADITPQVARIDAHVRPSTQVERYCYAEEVAHTLPQGLDRLRTQFQLGAEIFGSGSLVVDLEILSLLLELVSLARLQVPLQLDIGHVGVFRRLVQLAGLDEKAVNQVTDLYQRKALPELKEYCARLPGGDDLFNLALNGHDLHLLQSSLSASALNDPEISGILQQLASLRDTLDGMGPVAITVDAAELQGYHYHTGLVFALYAPDMAEPLAQGGRYDGIGHDFGQSRPATGFSCYLSKWLPFIPALPARQVISMPYVADPVLREQLRQARRDAQKAGHIVLPELPDQQSHDPRATHRFTLRDRQWVPLPV